MNKELDLIDRKELIRQIQLQANRSSLGETAYRELSFGEMVGLIMNAPTVDVVRHGRWLEGFDGSCMCSECNKVVRYNIGYYCPHCGAKMKGEYIWLT